ncbi:hypothetical protein ScPMuIL_015284 [Solemya velum]
MPRAASYSLGHEDPVWSLVMDCPIPMCAAMPFHRFCAETKQTTFEFNGRQCPGCTVCVNDGHQSSDSRSKKQAVNRPICLPPPCAFPAFCQETKPSYYYIDGHRCPGCPICVKETDPPLAS